MRRKYPPKHLFTLGGESHDGTAPVCFRGHPLDLASRFQSVENAGECPLCHEGSGGKFRARHPSRISQGSDDIKLRRRQPDTWFAVEYGFEFRHEPIYKPRWDVDAPDVAEAMLAEMVAAPAAKLLARHEELSPEEFVALVEDVIGDRATVTHSSSDALAEISALGVTKASGLAKVAAQHGVGPEDVVVFGDMPNDIAAFEWVRAAGGRAVAMADAHPDLMAVATDVTGTNDDDGVAAFLQSL